MRLKPTRTSAPVADLLSTAEVKQHIRVDFDGDDAVIDEMISAVTSYLDGYHGILRRALITQTWAEYFPAFGYRMPLRLGPVQSIDAVTYYDAEGVEQTVDASAYRLHETASTAYLVQTNGYSWPSADSRDDAVTISYVAGYGDAASDVPAAIRQAAKLLVAHWFENREGVVTGMPANVTPKGVDALLASYRRRKS